MKTLKCDRCDHIESAETFEEWMKALQPHYAKAHADFMKEQGEKSEQEQQAEMQKWMDENRSRFKTA